MRAMSFHVFTVGGIPVHVSIWYFLLLAFFVQGMGDPLEMAIFAVVMTLSLLTHEMGHALVARKLGLGPVVQLHGFGGQCAHERTRTDLQEAALVAAGPGAGLALAALSVAPMLLLHPTGLLGSTLQWLVWINVAWSLFNLLPLWPMDGGKLARLGLMRVLGATWGANIAHGLSLLLCAVGVALAISGKQLFLGIIAGMFGYQNAMILMGRQALAPARARNTETKGLLAQAESAYQAGELFEAQRIAHEARSLPMTTSAMEAHAWEIIALSAQGRGRAEECLRFERRAWKSPRLLEACLRAHLELEQLEQARALLEDERFGQLPEAAQRELLAALGAQE